MRPATRARLRARARLRLVGGDGHAAALEVPVPLQQGYRAIASLLLMTLRAMTLGSRHHDPLEASLLWRLPRVSLDLE